MYLRILLYQSTNLSWLDSLLSLLRYTIYLSTYLSIYLSIYVSIYVSIYLSIYLSRLSCRETEQMWFDMMMSYGDIGNFLSGFSLMSLVLYFVTSSDSGSLVIGTLSIHLSICLYIYLSIYPYMYIHLSIFIYLPHVPRSLLCDLQWLRLISYVYIIYLSIHLFIHIYIYLSLFYMLLKWLRLISYRYIIYLSIFI